MKDLIEKILGYLPQYFKDFGSLISRPKIFLKEKNSSTDENFDKALLFLGISLVVVVCATASFQSAGKDIWTYAIATSVEYILIVSLGALGLRLAWRAVGGKAAIKSFFITYAYFFGVVAILMNLFQIIGQGLANFFVKAIVAMQTDAQVPKLSAAEMSKIIIFSINFIYSILQIAILVWVFITWGAYRELNGLSKGRSLLAMVITVLFGTITSPIIFFVRTAFASP